MNKFKVAVAQTACCDDMEKNYLGAERMIAEAAEQGALLIVFPEVMNYVGVPDKKSYERIPEGECCRRLSAAAKQHGIWVNIGSIREINPEDPDGKPYNTSVLFSPKGELVAKYRKLHLSDMQVSRDKAPVLESDRIAPGNEIVVADTDLGKIGMSICYDLRFPEMYRLMSEKGARIICHPSSFSATTGAAHWEILLRSIAVLNHCYVLASNHCGARADGTAKKWGHSMIIDPWGTVIAEAGFDREALLISEIDLDYCDDLQGRLGCMNNRRGDIYSLKEL